MKCFYHVDNDGKCAGFWVRKLAKHYDGYEKEFIPINYGIEFPFETIRPNEQIFIVDYSILPEEMDKLLKITQDVIWIDHHASAIKRYDNYPRRIDGLRYDGVAGCMLTYCYLSHMLCESSNAGKLIFPFDLNMTKDAPMFTKYIADYDVWTFKYCNTKEFNLGSQLYDLHPESEVWDELLNQHKHHYNELLISIINQGETIITYRDNWAKEYCEHKGFEVEFEGYKCFALNLAMISSDHFKSINEDDYDMFIGFSYDGELWTYSLRSTKVNCYEIAMKYGGGGHKGAAGFTSKELVLKR